MTGGDAASAMRGYVRFGPGQDDDRLRQITMLRDAGVDEGAITVEHDCADDSTRPLLRELLTSIGPGEVVVVCSLDRLGPVLGELVAVGVALHRAGAELLCLGEDLDTRQLGSPAILEALALLAGFRPPGRGGNPGDAQTAGLVRQRPLGRPPRLSAEQAGEARRLHQDGMSVSRIALMLGVPRTTVYGYVTRT